MSVRRALDVNEAAHELRRAERAPLYSCSSRLCVLLVSVSGSRSWSLCPGLLSPGLAPGLWLLVSVRVSGSWSGFGSLSPGLCLRVSVRVSVVPALLSGLFSRFSSGPAAARSVRSSCCFGVPLRSSSGPPPVPPLTAAAAPVLSVTLDPVLPHLLTSSFEKFQTRFCWFFLVPFPR